MLLRAFGGKTPPGRGRRALRYARRRWQACDLGPVALTKGQEGVRKHHKRHMAMEPIPEATFIVVESQFSLGVLIEALDDPSHVHQFDEVIDRCFVHVPGEVLLVIAAATGKRALADEPSLAFEVRAALSSAEDAYARALLDERSFQPITPGNLLPGSTCIEDLARA